MLCEVLDVSDPTAVVPRVRALTEETAPREDSSAASTPARAGELSPEVADVLGIDTVEDAQELAEIVQRMSETLAAHREKREALEEELGVADPQDVLDLVQSLEEQLSAFYDAQSHSSSDQLATQIERILGISSLEDAHELESLVHRMNERLEEVSEAQETLQAAGYDPETALATINSMEDQLVALYGEREESESSVSSNGDAPLAETVTDILGLTTPAEARQLNESVRRMSKRLDALQSEQQALADAGLTAEDAVAMLENMSDQLSSLYEERDERTETLLSHIDTLTDRLDIASVEAAAPEAALAHIVDEVGPSSTGAPAQAPSNEWSTVQDILGISSAKDAKDLAAVAESMSAQLETLYADREHLQEVGVTSVESAVQMIQNMSTQLDELYEEQELLQGRPSPAEVEHQDTFEQLAALYSEQEKLNRALGVSEADDVIEMVEALTAQLEEVYADREEAPASDDGPSSTIADDDNEVEARHNGSEHKGSPPPDRLTQTPVFSSMQDQLESLYEEKEALLNIGIDDAQTAAGRIDTLEARLSSLQHEHKHCRDRLEHLQRKLGTTDVEQIVAMAASGSSIESYAPSGSAPPPSGASPESHSEDDLPVILPRETLATIDDLSREELDALSVGVLRLDDDGAIKYLNEAALALPDLDAESPRDELLDAFFFRAVPSASNTLFLNRFRTGVDQKQMDARFPYTFVTSQHPPSAFYVHLYRSGPPGANWILLRPAR